MSYRIVEGSTFTATIELVDDSGSPVMAAPGWPRVKVIDDEGDTLGAFNGAPDTTKPGTWSANVSVPLIGLKKVKEFKLRWDCKDVSGEKSKTYDVLYVAPKVESRSSEIVALTDDEKIDFVLPFAYTVGQAPRCKVYTQNDVSVADFDLIDADLDRSVDSTAVTLDNPNLPASLAPHLLVVQAKIDGRRKSFTYRYWSITPQVMVAASMIESFLNKAKLDNVIPELQYTDSDLVSYLERGLYLFNMTGYPTAFNGLNMQGAILDSWVICSTYWAIASQLVAEGSLSFDFNGQGISFNVDRTPQLDSALGRIESRIQDTVLPLKKKLSSQNLISGDGSIGATAMRNAHSLGTLSLTNAATTRVHGFSPYMGRRF